MEPDKSGLRQKLTAAVFIAVIGCFFVLCRILEPPEILLSERRAPATLPALTVSNVTSGEYMSRFENFAADSFPLREGFRTLRAAIVFGLYLQTDKDGLYMSEAGAGEIRPVNIASYQRSAEKIAAVAGSLAGLNVYYAIIPDKSVYAGRSMPGFDPALAQNVLQKNPGIDNLTFIPLVDALTAGSFYITDIHWAQTETGGVLDALGLAMGFSADLSRYTEKYAGEFQGIYPGQLALPIGTDSLRYLDSPDLAAWYLNDKTLEMEPGPIYDLERFSALDPYDIFLRGAQPLIIIENSAAAADRELYIFRDSFSSSLGPLIASGYSKVTLIDLRYLDSRLLSRFIDFKPGSDALFLYSSQILNNSGVLLVQ